MDKYLPLQQGTETTVNGQISITNSNGDNPEMQFQKLGSSPATIIYDGSKLNIDTPIIVNTDIQYLVSGQTFSVKDQITTIQSTLQEYDIDINRNQGYISALQVQTDANTSKLNSTYSNPVQSGLQDQISDNLISTNNALNSVNTTVTNNYNTLDQRITDTQSTLSQGIQSLASSVTAAGYQNEQQVSSAITAGLQPYNTAQETIAFVEQSISTATNGLQNATQVQELINTSLVPFSTTSQVQSMINANTTQIDQVNQNLADNYWTAVITDNYIASAEVDALDRVEQMYVKKTDAPTQIQGLIDTSLQGYTNTTGMNTAISTAVTNGTNGLQNATQVQELINTSLIPYSNTTDMNTAISSSIVAATSQFQTGTQVQNTISQALTPYLTQSQIQSVFATISTTDNLQTQINQLAAGSVSYEGYYVNETSGSDTTGDGSSGKPWASIQKVLNTFASTRTIYVKSSTTANVVFRSVNQSIQIIYDPKTQHSGSITLVSGNTSIYFLGKTGWIQGNISDASLGTIYFDCIVSGAYNKNNSYKGTIPQGYLEFSRNSYIDSLALTCSTSTIIKTCGQGSMGQANITAGVILFAHAGSMYQPIITNGNTSYPPIVAFLSMQFNSPISTGVNGTDPVALKVNLSSGAVILNGCSFMIPGFYSNIDCTGSSGTFALYLMSNQMARSGDVIVNPVFENRIDQVESKYTSTNWNNTNNKTVKDTIIAIDTKIGTLALASDLATTNTNVTNNTNSITTLDSQMGSTVSVPVTSGLQNQITNNLGSMNTFINTTAPATYQTISGMSNYLTIADASAEYYTKTNADTQFLSQANAALGYLKISDAGTIYQTIYDTQQNYYTKSGASAIFVTSTYLQSYYNTIIASDAKYLSQTAASTTYLTIASGDAKYGLLSTQNTLVSQLGSTATSIVQSGLQDQITANLNTLTTFTGTTAPSLYLKISDASSQYKSISSFNTDIANYLTTLSAASLYLSLTDGRAAQWTWSSGSVMTLNGTLDVPSIQTNGVTCMLPKYFNNSIYLTDLTIPTVTNGYNVFLGKQSGSTTISSNSSYNVGIGYLALGQATSNAYKNIAIGYQPLKTIRASSYGNVGIGDSSLIAFQDSCNYNTAVGTNAGGNSANTYTSCTYCNYFGAITLSSGSSTVTGLTNESVFGSGVAGSPLYGKGSNTTIIGGSAGVYQQNNSANFSTTSDIRIKKNIQSNTTYTLDTLMKLKLVDFDYIQPDSNNPNPLILNNMPTFRETGLIAQDTKTVFPDAVISPQDDSVQAYSIDYHYINLLLLASVQELTNKVQSIQQSDGIKPGDCFLSYPNQNGTMRNGHTILQCNGAVIDAKYTQLKQNLGSNNLPYMLGTGSQIWYCFVD